jgi:hypothetical protein
MHPDLSCQHFFLACFIYASPSLSSLFSFLDMTSLDSAEKPQQPSALADTVNECSLAVFCCTAGHILQSLCLAGRERDG